MLWKRGRPYAGFRAGHLLGQEASLFGLVMPIPGRKYLRHQLPLTKTEQLHLSPTNSGIHTRNTARRRDLKQKSCPSRGWGSAGRKSVVALSSARSVPVEGFKIVSRLLPE
jgi:hypothetical protein